MPVIINLIVSDLIFVIVHEYNKLKLYSHTICNNYVQCIILDLYIEVENWF